MISYPIYKLIHYLGIFVVMIASAGTLARALEESPTPDPWRRRLGWGHGMGLFLILLGGFGMLARLNITEGLTLPGWIWAKLAIWTLIGGVVALRRKPRFALLGLIALPVLALAAGWMALYKPL